MEMDLMNAQLGKEHKILHIDAHDPELEAFLFSLGCYTGKCITVVSRLKSGCTVAIKDGRYHIDSNLASAICVEAQ